MHDKKVVEQAIAIHTETYGTEPTAVAYAPGRVEVLGNHTDYNEGTVLSAAINMGHCFCISASGKPGVRLTAGDILETTEFDPASDERLPKNVQWANYVKGVMFYLRDQNVEIDSVDCTFLGSIPMGAGLSSSAALEVATAYAVLEYTGEVLDPKEIAKIGQKSEHDFAGCSCGLLDQFSSIFGVHHGLLHSDFRSLETYPVKLPDDVVFLMINPHIKHALADSPYNERPSVAKWPPPNSTHCLIIQSKHCAMFRGKSSKPTRRRSIPKPPNAPRTSSAKSPASKKA